MRILCRVIDSRSAALLLACLLLTETPAGSTVPYAPVQVSVSSAGAASPDTYLFFHSSLTFMAVLLTEPRRMTVPITSEPQSLRQRSWDKTVEAFLVHPCPSMPSTQVVYGSGCTSASPARPVYDILHVHRL